MDIPKETILRVAAAQVTRKWVLPIVHYLALHPDARFNDIATDLGISPSMLAYRLKSMERRPALLITKTTISTKPPHTTYTLTPKGQALVPVLHAIDDWAEVHLYPNLRQQDINKFLRKPKKGGTK